MTLVSNTGPLIALAKINALDLLAKLAAEAHIPSTVHRELLAKIGPEAGRIDDALKTFIKVAPLPTLASPQHASLNTLGAGERDAISLAAGQRRILLIDDLLARKIAKDLRLDITGTAGILIRAKRAGLVPHVKPLLEALRHEGYWLSDALLAYALDLAGE